MLRSTVLAVSLLVACTPPPEEGDIFPLRQDTAYATRSSWSVSLSVEGDYDYARLSVTSDNPDVIAITEPPDLGFWVTARRPGRAQLELRYDGDVFKRFPVEVAEPATLGLDFVMQSELPEDTRPVEGDEILAIRDAWLVFVVRSQDAAGRTLTGNAGLLVPETFDDRGDAFGQYFPAADTIDVVHDTLGRTYRQRVVGMSDVASVELRRDQAEDGEARDICVELVARNQEGQRIYGVVPEWRVDGPTYWDQGYYCYFYDPQAAPQILTAEVAGQVLTLDVRQGHEDFEPVCCTMSPGRAPRSSLGAALLLAGLLLLRRRRVG